jgi:hypothetical protein
VFEQVGDFPYFWAIVREGCPRFICAAVVGVSLVGFLSCICRFSLRSRFCGKLLFLAISYITVHSFHFL